MFQDNRNGSNSGGGRSGGYRNNNHSNRGGNSYGGNSGGYGGGSRGGYNQEKIAFHTQCHDCGNDCTVPFKPNGRKPVRCSDCFRNSGGGNNDRGSRGGYNDRGNDRGSRGGYNDRPRYNDRPAQAPKPKQNIGPTLKEEIRSINEKLGKILSMIERTPEVHTIKMEDAPEEAPKKEEVKEEAPSLEESISFLDDVDAE
jgi:CxxC-x17-CxxC domain-containing protein